MKKIGEKAKLQNQIKIQYSKTTQFQSAKIESIKIRKWIFFKKFYNVE